MLEALAEGRKVDGKDTASHVDGIAEKLFEKHGEAFSNDNMEAYRAALTDAILRVATHNRDLIQPWGRDPEALDTEKNFTRDWRKKAEKRSYFSAAELADKIIGGVTKTKVDSAFMVTRRARDMKQVTGAISRMKDRLQDTKPIFGHLCTYLLEHDKVEITEDNANVLLSAMTKAYFVRGTNAETGKMESSFVIPRNVPFMAGAGNVTWQKKDKQGKNTGETLRFKTEGDNFVVLLQDRRHLLDLVFPKLEKAVPAAPASAALGLLTEMVKNDEKAE